MPFDSMTTDKDVTGKLAFEKFQRQPTLEGLAYALRHPEVWPTRFGPWSYTDGDHCAVGLTRQLLAQGSRSRLRFGRQWLRAYGPTEEIYQISRPTYVAIFISCRPRQGVLDASENVRPDDVANAIDQFLMKQQAREQVHAV